MMLKANEHSLGVLNREMYVCTFKKTIIVLFGRRIEKIVYLTGWEIGRIFKQVKKIKENNLKQRFGYRFPKHGTVDQLENVFVIDLETYNDQQFAEAYAAGLYDVNRLRDTWDRDLTPEEIVTEKDNVIVFDGSNANPVTKMLK